MQSKYQTTYNYADKTMTVELWEGCIKGKWITLDRKVNIERAPAVRWAEELIKDHANRNRVDKEYYDKHGYIQSEW